MSPLNMLKSLNPEAVPKKILELMNVDKLTRENVASHLQVNIFFDSHLSKMILFHELRVSYLTSLFFFFFSFTEIPAVFEKNQLSG